MSELKKIQEAIQAYIQNGNYTAFDYVTEPKNNSAAVRLQVYRNSYFLRVIDILTGDYPKLASQLGKATFGQLVHDYSQAMPSQHYSVRELGRALPLFVENYFSERDDLIELVRLERALLDVVFFESEPILTLQALTRLSDTDWPSYHFRLVNAHKLIQLHAKAADYFNIECVDEVVVLVWKRQDRAFYQPLSKEDACLINYFNQGLDFAEVCEKISQHLGEEGSISFIFQRIQYWITQGIFNDN